jgi:hypothetical protein
MRGHSARIGAANANSEYSEWGCCHAERIHTAHFIQHFYVHAATPTPLFWFGMAVAVLVDMLSIIGGVLLLRRNVTS